MLDFEMSLYSRFTARLSRLVTCTASVSYDLCAKYFSYSNHIDFKGSLRSGVTLQLTGKVKPECPLLAVEELRYG